MLPRSRGVLRYVRQATWSSNSSVAVTTSLGVAIRRVRSSSRQWAPVACTAAVVGAAACAARLLCEEEEKEKGSGGRGTRQQLQEIVQRLDKIEAGLAAKHAEGQQACELLPHHLPCTGVTRWQERVYRDTVIEGWAVHVNQRLLGTPTGQEALKLLAAQLYNVTRIVPKDRLPTLRAIPIWVEPDNDRHIACCCYHVSDTWLREHGYNPNKAHSIEITRADRLLSYSLDEPLIILHELAHGFHDQLGWDNETILAAFKEAVASGRYSKVLRVSRHHEKHYGLTDVREYFAKMSEAYLGTSDFFPFVRAELAEYDPTAYVVFDLMYTLWGPRPGPHTYELPSAEA